MKELKVKKNNLLLFIAFLYPLFSSAANTVIHCSDKAMQLNCVDQQNGNYSLEGTLELNKKIYNITARRAFGKDWCKLSLNKIKAISSANRFCVEAEAIQVSDRQLTINSISSSKGSWDYFKKSI